MVDITQLPSDIYSLICNYLYFYDNQLRFINKSINNNIDYIKINHMLIKKRLLNLKKNYNSYKIQACIKKYIYDKKTFSNYDFNYQRNLYLPHYDFGEEIQIILPRYDFYHYPSNIFQVPIFINTNHNDHSNNSNSNKSKKKEKSNYDIIIKKKKFNKNYQKRKSKNQYNGKIYKKNFKSFRNSFRKR